MINTMHLHSYSFDCEKKVSIGEILKIENRNELVTDIWKVIYKEDGTKEHFDNKKLEDKIENNAIQYLETLSRGNKSIRKSIYIVERPGLISKFGVKPILNSWDGYKELNKKLRNKKL